PATLGGSGAMPATAIVAVGVTLIFWSGTAIANKFAVAHIDAITAGTFRSMLAGFVALGIALALRLPFPTTSGHRLLLVYSGWVNFAIWPGMLSLGIALANASHAALIMALIPVYTGLFAALMERRRLKRGWWLGAAIAIAGTAVLVVFSRPAAELAISTNYLIGDLVILAGVGLCASGYVAGARLSPVIGSWGSTFWGLAAALLILVPTVAFLFDRTDWSAVPLGGWASIAWLAFLSSLAGYALWFLAMDKAGVARIAVWQFAQPVLTLAAAAVLLDEPITWPIVVAATAVIGGTYLAHRHAH
ncbi:MAG: DMT family transporter, partial [Bauldia litoralis]